MKSFEYTVRDEVGIHARPAGMLVNKAKTLESRITLKKDGKTADATKLFSVMSLGVKCGDTVTVTAEGDDEDAAINEMLEFFKSTL